jgi:tetratricopeptide (TPR) repeat protein
MLTSETRTRNAFQETMLGLTFSPLRESDLFSRACVEQYHAADLSRHGYRFAQVFEPNVLHEVALLEGIPYDSLAELRHRPSAATARLGELADGARDLSVVESINVAAALVSISRFGPAALILDQTEPRATTPHDAFEVAMLRFVVANRRGDGPATSRAFLAMRRAIESGPLPADRTLDACAQAVVWYMKRRDLPTADFLWYVAAGRELARRPRQVGTGSLSAWYRALAMVPAARGKAQLTRRYMEFTRAAAADSLSRQPRAYEAHFLKTYHESSLKEHMYVTRDADRAEEEGRALIALDPAWSPSYGELADAYAHFDRLADAAALYEKAVAIGPPYYGHHLLKAARARERLGDDTRALEHYQRLTDLVPGDETVLRHGLAVARRSGHSAVAHFQRLLDQPRTPAGGTT